MLTRQDYIAKRCTFSEYYTAILQTAGIHNPTPHMMDLVRQSRDKENLNDISLAVWDVNAAMHRIALQRAFREHGDHWSMAGGVCAMKQLCKNKR